ncbi:MAG: replication protein, partial [Planctomycetes bacterium]|nr:replication protein [Planctomycetota bacterium]
QIQHALAYDEFLATVMVSPGNDGQWRPIDDNDVTTIRIELERLGFHDVALEKVRAVIDHVAQQNRFDSAKEWLSRMPAWDGVPRVDRFLVRYLGAEDRDYTRAVSRYLLTALVGRIMSPGCKVDMVPVLVGAQGIGKSTSITALLPSHEFFVEVDLGNTRDADQARLLRGKLIGEIAELRGLATRDAESIKAWIVRTHEEWTPKYKEHPTRFARRCIFIGTTNDNEFLTDPTGNRRWLPVRVGACDVPAICADREQLYAEALAIYREEGIQWREAERLAVSEHAYYIVGDEWDEPIRQFLAESGARVSAREIAAQVLALELRQVDQRVVKRIAAALRRIGAVRFRGRDSSGATRWLWARPGGRKLSAADLV